jgi:hypothetical protein
MKGGVEEATAMVMDLRENYNIFCSIVVYPVIPKGHIIYRLIPTAVHTDEEIALTLKAFEETKEKLREANLGEKNPNFGNNFPPYHMTDQTRLKIKLSMRKYYNTDNKPVKNKLILKPCIIDNIEYVSVNNASKVLEIPKGTIHRRLNSKNFPNYIWK